MTELVSSSDSREPGGVDRPVLTGHEAEADRLLHICNACRYCEGFCAVFPAMTRRLEFGQADTHYLANLCHNCGACLYACQYAPPHEFAVAVPQAMAKVRRDTYGNYAWPQALAGLYRRNGLTVALALALSLSLLLWLAVAVKGTFGVSAPDGNFFAVFGHDYLVALFSPIFLFAVLALGIGVSRWWRATAEPGEPVTLPAAVEATSHVMQLKYLDGGHGEGCNNADDEFSLARRYLHHLTFYGFGLCFAATAVGTLYHFLLGWHAPYALTSLPVILGLLGGVGLLIGPAGLWWLSLKRAPLQGDHAQRPMDWGFMALLFLSSASGLALLFGRATPAMPGLLVAHLGIVMALFLTMPYGKFAHSVYRAAALLKWAIERRQPSRLQLGDD